ncbi:hypothetical protein SAY86_030758 [Trapa natans]|uniref:Peptidase metallopeptidase domain-containing protein n=1 Tax=Trapa natans TaxID=22666 RepID=A0AAN7M5I0_TRANT|nr:hypothetical protein SAY86_030758 [Trapa natans]
MALTIASLHSQLLIILVGSLALFLAIIQPSLAHSRKLIVESPEKAADSDRFGSLDDVRRYLERFGYKEKPFEYPNGATGDTLTTESSLYEAISLYQQKNHLKVTGKLDTETAARMRTPRCGMPDIIPSGRKGGSTAAGHHHHGTSKHGKLLHVVGHYNYFANMSPWTKSEITYSFTSTVPLVSLENLRAICNRAFQRWAAVTPFQFREAGEGDPEADITIGFYTGDHGDGVPFDGPGNVWAHAFAPQDGRLHFDGSEQWSTSTPTLDETDLESVALHEIGHTLGLAHTADQDAVMYAYIGQGDVKRELQQDDINGIRALYPSK